LSLRAEFEQAAGQHKAAAATMADVLKARPNDPDALLSLAQINVKLGKRAEASQLLERIAADPAANAALLGRVVATALRLDAAPLARKLAEQALLRMPNEPQAALSLAAVKAAQNDLPGAWASTLAVLDKQPANVNALLGLSGMTRTADQRKTLLERHELAMGSGASVPQLYLDYAALLRFGGVAAGMLSASGGNAKSPLAVLEKGGKAFPDSVALRRELVQEMLRAGDADKAAALAQTGADALNANAEVLTLAADTLDQLGKSAQAATYHRKLVAAFPQRADWALRLARSEAALGRQDQALALLRTLVKDRPFDPQAYVALAQLLSKDNTSEALAVAKQMGEQGNLVSASQLLAGDVLLAAGRSNEALEQFAAAAKSGAVVQASLRKIAALDQDRRREAADLEMSSALRRFPNEAAVVAVAAKRAQAAGDANKAADLLQRLSTDAPNDPYLANDLAWAQIAAGRAEALTHAKRALAALPNNANVLDTYGMALMKAGQTDEAVAALKAASNLAPGAALPRLHLAQALWAAKDKTAAAPLLRGLNESQLSAADKQSLQKLRAAVDVN
jgi:cellulose synthase operon protein C